MSGKQEKKLRQLHRRDFNKKMESITADLYGQMKKLLKPCPKWFPKWLWYRLGKQFLNI